MVVFQGGVIVDGNTWSGWEIINDRLMVKAMRRNIL